MNATNRSNARRVARIHGGRIARIHAYIDNVATALAWGMLGYGVLVMFLLIAAGLQVQA